MVQVAIAEDEDLIGMEHNLCSYCGGEKLSDSSLAHPPILEADTRLITYCAVTIGHNLC